MLEERDIIRHCESRMLRRARNIAQTDDAVFNRRCGYDTGEKPLTKLRAKVQSSADWRTSYDVDLTIDEDDGKVVDYDCTCAASLSSPGMCKHVAAVALTFLEAPASFAGHMSVRTTQSSAGVKKTLEQAAESRVTELALPRADAQGLIDIEPCLVCTKDGWGVRFSVASIEGKYVVKDIAAFLALCRSQKTHTYGERLTFEHTRSAFTPGALKLISFIERCMDIREQLSSDALNSYRIAQGDMRGAMQLSAPEIVELLTLCSGRPLYVDDCTKLNHRATHTRIIEGNPPLRVSLVAQQGGGYLIEHDVDARIIRYDDTVFVWADELFFLCDERFESCLPFLENVYCNASEQAYLSSNDAAAFCRSVLPVIERFIEVDIPEELESLRPRNCEIEIYLDRDGRVCVCEAYAVYDAERVALVEPEGKRASLEYGLRDEERETQARNVLHRYFPIVDSSCSDADHGLRVSDDANIASILNSGLAEFRVLGTLFTTPAFDSFFSSRRPKVSFGLSIRSNLVDLSASVDDLPKKELAALLDSYHKRRRYHRLADGSFVDLSASDWALADDYASELGMDTAKLLMNGAQLPLYRAFQLDGLIEGAQRDHAFYDYIKSIENASITPATTPEGFMGELRPYQLDGLTWLDTISQMGLGGILADEMGLGKTIQLIAYVVAHLGESRAWGPSLIVCPASVVYNWIAEFERFAPGVRVHAVAGAKEERDAALSACAEDGMIDGEQVDVLVTSYDLLRRDVESYEELSLFMVALDEAQYIKNHATVSARSVKSLDALHRFALTGTPIENRLSELWSIFDFLMPGMLGTYDSFRSRYEQPILDGDERALEHLQALVSNFILRRVKQDVLTDLPEKDESVVYAHLGDEQMRLYRAMEQRLRESINARTRQSFSADKIAVLAEITRLRELCCDPDLLFEDYEGESAKLDTILELINSANESGEKTLVFSQFVRFLEIIAARLDEREIPYFVITGSTPKHQRIKLVNEFNEDDTPVFLVSLKAGGTGLNLTGASVVIHSDPWWNLAAENQATDRAHRIGQKRAVSVYKVIAKDTIEERVVALQQAKSKLADKFVRGDGTPLATLTQDELLTLLQG